MASSSSSKTKKELDHEEERNWLELPREVTASILSRLRATDIIDNVQMVCKAWLEICKDPLVWRTIDMYNIGEPGLDTDLDRLCRLVVDRSSGQLVDINIEYFGDDDLLSYITRRSTQIKRLRLVCCHYVSDEGLIETIEKLPLLEELDLTLCSFAIEPLEAIGRCCPRLRSLKLNSQACHPPLTMDPDAEEDYNEEVLAISKYMPQLRHLQLIGNSMTNKGLQAILDGCPHLESLDLRRCLNIDLEGDLGRRCAEQIKYLRLPNDSTKDYGFLAGPDDGNGPNGSVNGSVLCYQDYADSSDYDEDDSIMIDEDSDESETISSH